MSEHQTELTKLYKLISKLEKVGSKNIWTEIEDLQSFHKCIDLAQVEFFYKYNFKSFTEFFIPRDFLTMKAIQSYQKKY